MATGGSHLGNPGLGYHAAREAGQDRGEGGQAQQIRYVPACRSGGVEGPVPENPEPD